MIGRFHGILKLNHSSRILTPELIQTFEHGMNSLLLVFISRYGNISRLSNTIPHYNDVIMTAMASQITSRAIAHSIVYSGSDQTKHKSSASLAFVRGIHRWPVNSPHKRPVTRKMFLFDDVITHTLLLAARCIAVLCDDKSQHGGNCGIIGVS